MSTLKNEKKPPMEVTTENVAVPEVHIEPEENLEDQDQASGISYDNLAFPEIHIRKK